MCFQQRTEFSEGILESIVFVSSVVSLFKIFLQLSCPLVVFMFGVYTTILAQHFFVPKYAFNKEPNFLTKFLINMW